MRWRRATAANAIRHAPRASEFAQMGLEQLAYSSRELINSEES